MAAKKKNNSKNVELAQLVERLGITMREARDIATAVSNVAVSKGSAKTRKNLVKQVKEVKTAITKAETGTTPGKVKGGKFKKGKFRDYPNTFMVINPNKKEKPVSIRKKRFV
jgi:hypothetical protein